MRSGTVLAVCGLMAVFSFPAHAQTETPAVELAGAYSYMRTNIAAGPHFTEGLQTNGGYGEITFNVTKSVGIVGQVGGYNSSTIRAAGFQDISFASYLFGPRFSMHRWDTLIPYVQTLVGGVKGNNAITVPGSGVFHADQSAFGWTVGGGLDSKLFKHLNIRVVQAEYFLTKWNDGVNNRQNNFRISTGLILTFGKK
jgi:opacity protein-like surface antigen